MSGETSALEAFDTRVIHAFDESFAPGGEWDQLLASSRANTVFLLSGWLRAWHETLGRGVDLIIPQIRHEGRLVACAAFQARAGIVEFAGAGPSDYCDIVVADGFQPAVARHLIRTLIHAAHRSVPRFRWSRLSNILLGDSLTPSVVFGPGSGVFATEERRIPVPIMDMSVVEEKLRKKSLRRHHRALERKGTLTCNTDRDADRILPQLDEFFDQHVRRWQLTKWPSLFLEEAQRAFYRAVTERLDGLGVLRFTTVRLDGRLVAAHYGFLHAGSFIWYKPSFEPDLASMSPGEVLLKLLLELARAENAAEFDFTIGAEPFKLRFATKVREVINIHLTESRMLALARRVRVRVRETLESG
jgi:CelD/BcsL family acetyltransferase involved in cellulose biosynthesis